MLEKVHIIKITVQDKKADGTPMINKWGKPFYRVGIQTREYGNAWINGFMNFPPTGWENSEQEMEIYEEEYNGKMQKKFKLPTKEDKLELRMTALELRIDKMAEYIKNKLP